MGSMQGAVRLRYCDNKSSFTHERYWHKTTLANYVWEVKNKFGIDPELKWEIEKYLIFADIGKIG